MRLQAALNGPRTRDEHPALPVLPHELAADAAVCAAAGCFGVHVHPRDEDGRETLDCSAAVRALRAAGDFEISLTTGEWIEPDLERRLAAIRAWRHDPPDVASVNLAEEGAIEVCRALRDAGVEVEAGLASVADAERWLGSGVEDWTRRVLVEPYDTDSRALVAHVHAIEAALDSVRPDVPRLVHGDGAATWAAVRDGLRRGRAARIGFEDVLTLEDGSVATGNEALVRAVVALAGGR